MAATIDNGGPAFPVVPPLDSAGDSPRGYPYPDAGMSLRDYFAGQALAGMATWCPTARSALNSPEALNARADWAYEQADAMLAKRGK
jgi:hypothetical protein